MRATRLFFFFLAVSSIAASAFSQTTQDWRTDYEKSGYFRTPRYAETIAYCQRLAKASPWVKYTTFGVSPQGRDLPLVIVSKEGAFTPAAAAKTGKAILLIQSGIHAGEIDGKDASLMLIRDIAITKTKASLLDRAIVLFIPIFNVDGHERFGPYNRINQNGPVEMGWRVNAENLNLNRDYLKADAPEMRDFLKLYTDWLPDFYVDCHVTDGINFQYDVTYMCEIYGNIDQGIAAWLTTKYIPYMTSTVEKEGHLIAPYIIPREDRDLSKGLVAWPSTPRFSTGYAALQNRPSLLIETHMLKSYKVRVSATYAILDATIRRVGEEAKDLHRIIRDADARSASLWTHSTWLPLNFDNDGTSHPIFFRGIASRIVHSDVSGGPRLEYTGQVKNDTIPYYNGFRTTDSARVPRLYYIPQEWKKEVALLKLHGVQMYQLRSDTTLKAVVYHLTDPQWQAQSYEGRHPLECRESSYVEERTLPAGTFVVPTDQRTSRVIVNLLEPKGPDSFVSWGFFDAIFEQKEYAEPYVLEEMAPTMLARDTVLRAEFEQKVAADTAFAHNPRARLNFFYRRTPYWDRTIGLYPIVKSAD